MFGVYNMIPRLTGRALYNPHQHDFLLLACPHSNLTPLLRHKFRPVSLDNDRPKDLTGRVMRSSMFAAVHGGFSDVWAGTYNMSEDVEDIKVI